MAAQPLVIAWQPGGVRLHCGHWGLRVRTARGRLARRCRVRARRPPGLSGGGLPWRASHVGSGRVSSLSMYDLASRRSCGLPRNRTQRPCLVDRFCAMADGRCHMCDKNIRPPRVCMLYPPAARPQEARWQYAQIDEITSTCLIVVDQSTGRTKRANCSHRFANILCLTMRVCIAPARAMLGVLRSTSHKMRCELFVAPHEAPAHPTCMEGGPERSGEQVERSARDAR